MLPRTAYPPGVPCWVDLVQPDPHATERGGRAVSPLFDTDYTRQGTIEDPQGAVLTLSEYRPPS